MRILDFLVLKVNMHHPRRDQVVFADLIADGIKTVELRSYATEHRGPLLIEYRGSIVAYVWLDECRRSVVGDMSLAGIGENLPDPVVSELLKSFSFAWELTNARRLKTPFPSKGQGQLYKRRVTESECPELFE